MSNSGQPPFDEKEYNSLISLINRSLDGGSESGIHELALQKCHEYLLRYTNDIHWFCNEKLYPISIYSLILFSFPNNALSPSLRPYMAKSLTACNKCLLNYNTGKAELRLNFATIKKIPITNVQQFMEVINNWELEILVPVLEEVYNKVQSGGSNELNAKQVQVCINWCLGNPQIVRSHSSVKEKFGVLITLLLKVGSTDLFPKELLPGLWYLLLEGNNDADHKLWAQKWLQQLQQDQVVYSEASLSEAFILEFSVHLYRIEDPTFYSDHNAVKFWEAFNTVIDFIDNEALEKRLNAPSDIEVMSQYKNLRFYPVMRTLANSLMSEINGPLPIMLKTFAKILQRLKNTFWKVNFKNDPIELSHRILQNPFFFSHIENGTIENDTTPTTNITNIVNEKFDQGQWLLNDLVSWIPQMIASVDIIQRQPLSKKFSSFLLRFSSSNKLDYIERDSYLQNMGFKLLNNQFSFKDNEDNNSENSVELLKFRSIRVDIDEESEKLLLLAMRNFSHENNYATLLVSKCIRYDLSILVQNTLLLTDDKKPMLFDTFPILWNHLHRLKLSSNLALSQEIIKCFKNIRLIILFRPVKDTVEKPDITKVKVHHNDSVTAVIKYVNLILGNISLTSPQNLKLVLSDQNCLNSLWSCVFAPLSSQPALDFMNEVYDGTGRLELIQEGLKHNPKGFLTAINVNLKELTTLKIYEPSPKTVRILMDVIKAIADPLNPVLLSPGMASAHDEVKQFWSQALLFLVMIYEQAIIWAGRYHMHELVEFTRDTLDLSHLMLESFRLFADGLSVYEGKDCARQLFLDFMGAFGSMTLWLRLGDVALLNSCVELVMKVLDLAGEQQFGIEDVIIEKLTKFGVKFKRFNNKLSESQRTQILSKVRECNPHLVDQIVDEANRAKEKKSFEKDGERATSKRIGSPQGNIIDLTKEENSLQSNRHLIKFAEGDIGSKNFKQPTSQYNYGSDPDSTTVKRVGKQQTLGRFARILSEPPAAPPSSLPAKGTNSLDMIRKDLKLARTAPTKPDKTPAPPRPAGFNTKKAPPVIGRSLNTIRHARKVESDSSDEDEDNVDVSDLFVDKKKKVKVTEVDLHGRVVSSSSSSSSASSSHKRSAADEEKLEKERMAKRLNVNLKPLYLNVLKWNYNSKSEFPSEDRSMYEKVKNSYDKVKDYVKAMEPLLMLECWQAIQSAKDTIKETPFELVVGSRTSIDGFFDVFTSMSKKTIEDRKLIASDLIVLGCNNDATILRPEEQRNYLKAPNTLTCLAKVTLIKSAGPELADVTVRVYPSGPLIGALTPKTSIIGMKVMQMVTVEREFSSLRGLEYYDLSDAIIAAKPNPPIEVNDAEIEQMYKIYDVNKSQARAIKGTYESDGFSLIQGPPGTGKTKTILGIVGYALSHKESDKIIELPQKPAAKPSKGGKILICAPSNAAVDELVLRLRNGVKNSKGEHMDLKVVRLGRSDAINAAVRDLTLEELVDKELQSKQQEDVIIDPGIRAEHTKKVKERDQIKTRLSTESLSSKEIDKLETRLREVNKERSDLAKKLDEQRERASIAYRSREIGRRTIQTKILDDAQVLCATLSGSAHELISSLSVKFDQVIIDEACQCLELSAIIPLRYGCRKCIMVGDPNQLPPTVLSQAASSFNYEQSLFVRMQTNYPDSVYLLNVQYRMHPQISQFPSAEFYQSKLKDGPNMEEKNKRPWHSIKPLSPYRFFDIASRHTKNELTRSLFNLEEARICLQLVQKLITLIPQQAFAGKVGIISPYKEQIRTIKDVFVREYGKIILNEIDFNTVDGFQGQEKEIIIMSCVRASADGNVGFLSDVRRMNVALTRARTTLWILGNRESLLRNKVWNRLLKDAEQRNAVSNASPGFLSSKNEITSIATSTGAGTTSTKTIPPKLEGAPSKRLSNDSLVDKFDLKRQRKLAETFNTVHEQNSSSAYSGKRKLDKSVEKNILKQDSLPLSTTNATTHPSRLPFHVNNGTVQQAKNTQGLPAKPTKMSKPMQEQPPSKSMTEPKKADIPRPTSSGTLPKRPVGPTSSGVIRPPKPKPTSSIFIPRNKRK